MVNDVLGGLGDTGQPGLKKVLKVSANLTGHMSCLKAVSNTFAEKYALEEYLFFRSLARVFFLDFLRFWDALVGHFGEVFAQLLIVVWKTQHLRSHCFTIGLTLF